MPNINKNRKRRRSEFNALQVSAPGHLSQWPDLRVRAPPDFQPVRKPAKKVFKEESDDDEKSYGFSPRKEETKNSGFDGADESSSSSDVSRQDLAKSTNDDSDNNENDTATASASEDEDSKSGSEEEDAHLTNELSMKTATPPTNPKYLGSSSKHILKNAVESQKGRKKKQGLKPSVENNVFNARPATKPPAARTPPPARDSSQAAASTSKKSKKKKYHLIPPPSSALVPKIRSEGSDAPPPPSPIGKKSSKIPSMPSDAVNIPIPTAVSVTPSSTRRSDSNGLQDRDSNVDKAAAKP